MCLPNSLYRSHAGRHFNETENVIWAGFGPIGSTEKKNWDDYQQLLWTLFSCFGGQFFFLFKYCSVCTEKLHKISFKKKERNTSAPKT